MNFLIGKLTKSIKFDTSSHNGVGGEIDAVNIIKMLCENYPNDNFIMIGSSDKKYYAPNLFYCFDNFKIENTYNKIKDFKIDGIMLLLGPDVNVSIPNLIKQLESDNYCVPMDMAIHYTAPIVYALNKLNLPWVAISNDPRCLGTSLDLINKPTKILTQYDCTYTETNRKIDSFENQKRYDNISICEYAHVEKNLLYKAKFVKHNSKTFGIILNDVTGRGISRYPQLKEYVLDNFTDVEIYGKWSDEITKNDPRFKGVIPFDKAQRKYSEFRCMFIIPVAPGWVTSKYLECFMHGCVPLLHKSYDDQHHIEIPDFCRIKDPKDLKEKIDILTKDDTKYNELMDWFKQTYSKYIDGKILSEIIIKNTPKCSKPGSDPEKFEISNW